MIGLDNIKSKANEKGITILEALVSTAIIGIGFVAIFQMVQYAVHTMMANFKTRTLCMPETGIEKRFPVRVFNVKSRRIIPERV